MPGDGEKPHVFTEMLPRQRTASGDCDHCERPLGKDGGLPAVRDCLFTAREVAAALVRVADGMTYRSTGRYVRRLADRLKPGRGTIPPHPSRGGSLVEDWVEVFAPVVFEPRRPSAWPEVLILDDLPSVFARP